METSSSTEEWLKDEHRGASNFSTRRAAVFDSLQSLEDTYATNVKDNTCTSNNRKNQDLNPPGPDESSRSRRDDGISKVVARDHSPHSFKTPIVPAHRHRNRGSPRQARQHGKSNKKDPNKWTYYNMSDVTEDQMSDKANTAAAMDFLSSIRRNKETTEPRAILDQKHTFSSAKQSKSCGSSEQIDKSVELCSSDEKKYKAGVVVMPEYAVGKMKAPGAATALKRKHEVTQANEDDKKSDVSLGHLNDLEVQSNVHISANESNEPMIVDCPQKVEFNRGKKKSRNIRQRRDDE